MATEENKLIAASICLGLVVAHLDGKYVSMTLAFSFPFPRKLYVFNSFVTPLFIFSKIYACNPE
jgi:hypothetical protein